MEQAKGPVERLQEGLATRERKKLPRAVSNAVRWIQPGCHTINTSAYKTTREQLFCTSQLGTYAEPAYYNMTTVQFYRPIEIRPGADIEAQMVGPKVQVYLAAAHVIVDRLYPITESKK